MACALRMLRLVLVAAPFTFFGLPGANALNVRADLSDGIAEGRANSGGSTAELCGYSIQVTPTPIGPNANTGGSVPIGACSSILVRGFFFDQFYGPAVGDPNLPKPNSLDFMFSTSGNFTGRATYTPIAAAPALLSVAATGASGQTGAAAARSADPFQINPGVYPYVVDIDASLTAETVGDSAGANYFATDSRFPSPLWFLSIEADGPLTSAANLGITFTSNPILGLNDSSIESQLKSAFSISGDTATLGSFQLFDATYVVDQTITYSDQVTGSVQALEPSTLILLASAVALFMCLRAVFPMSRQTPQNL